MGEVTTLRTLARSVISYEVRCEALQEETWNELRKELPGDLVDEIFIDCLCKGVV